MVKRFSSLLVLPLLAVLVLSFAPARAQTDNGTCFDCHDDPDLESADGRSVGVAPKLFAASVHGDLDCVECHSTPGDFEDEPHWSSYVRVDCAECHDDVAEEFDGSVHHVGRQGRRNVVVACSDCHGTHDILSANEASAPTHHRNIPELCGRCHGDASLLVEDFVRLPASLPNYLASVHGRGLQNGAEKTPQRWNNGVTAACTDCHGVHNLRAPDDPLSSTYRTNIAATCGACHKDIAREYGNSIHGKAVALGIQDSPTCTDCHDEHLIEDPRAADARQNPEHRARELCGDCHTNPAMTSKYGVTAGVVESYLDSYHGWAVSRGSDLVATCTDCHNVHEIRSPLDPASTVHDANVTATCGKCHPGANPTFAQSYTHVSALAARGPQGWVRLVYLWVIAGVLGGMALHNFVIARYELRRHFRRRRSEPYVQRWRRAERLQHIVLLTSFFALAITGFALRFPDSWWTRLIGLDTNELLRAYLHRIFAVIMVGAAVYHTIWVIVTRRGRRSLGAMVPRYFDVAHAVQNMAFHLGLRGSRPSFGKFDYTQKAEYWAVVWGTVVMALTGFVLWYPTVATSSFPAWVVRVAEVIHFYEAILAVSAIIIWHFFYVIFMPSEYPVSTTWIDGRMPAEEWKEMHRGEYDAEGPGAIVPSEGDDMVTAADVRSHALAAEEKPSQERSSRFESGSKPGGGKNT